MSKIQPEDFAKILDWCERGHELSPENEKIAKENDLLVVFGYSDDNIELEGAISDEIWAFSKQKFHIDIPKKKVYLPSQHYVDEGELNEDFQDIMDFYLKDQCIDIEWEFKDNWVWELQTNAIHFRFNIMEDWEKFSDGLVIFM